ncbi:MAG: 16S rRNA (cytidine(1402)-2'-O)-methyltransferase [Oscillospiraceae bacterium]|nr:16S rRNA (cytidine(1402)-2'-O)-methyltransferase [Oscillospiraceae bacterium]
MSGRLYIVATPVGNLGDMTPRAVEILREVDIIAAEDTKNSMTLLTKFEIKTKLASNHKFNETGSADYFINELLNGKNIAVISDAGTPCISDPGSILVKRAVENNIEIIAIPGACAAVTAVSVSGFDIKSFIFEGFFPRENNQVKNIIKKLENNPGIYIFYESPKRIIKTFEIFSENLLDCNICLCNDLTKKFERIYRGSPVKILDELRNNPSAEKGEYTIVIDVIETAQTPVGVAGTPFQKGALSISIESVIVDVMIKQKCTVKDAVKYIASDSAYNFSKNEIYAASLNLKKMF